MDLRGHRLNDALAAELVHCGATAGRTAVLHADAPGSNRRVFAFEAYLRATELVHSALEADGYSTRHRGWALIGSKDGHELQFATASGIDLTEQGAFDPFTSKLRRRAATINSQLCMDALPGMPVPPTSAVIHLVWTFTQDDGLVAAQAGLLMPSGRGGGVRWDSLTALLRPEGGSGRRTEPPSGPLGYREQASSDIRLSRRPQARSDAG